MVTLKDIARVTGLDFRSVSHVLRNDPRYSAETRQSVHETATRMGYVPHHAARRLSRARSVSRATSFDQVGLIYLLRSDTDLDPVCMAMMSGAEFEFSKLQASLTFTRVAGDGDWKKVDRLARAGGVDGWLVYGGQTGDEVVKRLQSIDLPFVIMGDHSCTQPVPSVNIDNAGVARLAVEHLASLGHRRIAFLNGGPTFAYQRQTLEGFRAAVKEMGLDADERLIGKLPSLTSSDKLDVKLTSDWLRSVDPMPTALFTSEFDGAVEICRVLQQSGMKVPKEISIVGYEIPTLAVKRDNFTRIDSPMSEVGRQGALLLHRLVSEPRMRSGGVNVSASLTEGWSTCPPSNEGS